MRAALRLHPNQVRAIEQEDLTRLPEPAYVRGFIRSYARVLNIDPAPMLDDLNAKLAPAHGGRRLHGRGGLLAGHARRGARAVVAAWVIALRVDRCWSRLACSDGTQREADARVSRHPLLRRPLHAVAAAPAPVVAADSTPTPMSESHASYCTGCARRSIAARPIPAPLLQIRARLRGALRC